MCTKQAGQRPALKKNAEMVRRHVPNQGQVEAKIVIRNEKNAKKHSGSLQPIVLSAIPQDDEDAAPCPVQALRYAMLHTHPPRGDKLVFPDVTNKQVNRAMNKHAVKGDRHTAHAVR